MNKIMLQGRLVRDPEISPDHADDPKRMRCVFTAAVKRDYKRPDRPDTDFFRCVAFGPPASYLVRNGKKGDHSLYGSGIQPCVHLGMLKDIFHVLGAVCHQFRVEYGFSFFPLRA